MRKGGPVTPLATRESRHCARLCAVECGPLRKKRLWLRGDQFVGVNDRPTKAGDFLLEFGDQRVELRYLAGVLPLLVLAEAEEVGLILGPPAVEIELVLLDDRLSQLLGLVQRRAAPYVDPAEHGRP